MCGGGAKKACVGGLVVDGPQEVGALRGGLAQAKKKPQGNGATSQGDGVEEARVV